MSALHGLQRAYIIQGLHDPAGTECVNRNHIGAFDRFPRPFRESGVEACHGSTRCSHMNQQLRKF